jgi:hypothetical protein
MSTRCRPRPCVDYGVVLGQRGNAGRRARVRDLDPYRVAQAEDGDCDGAGLAVRPSPFRVGVTDRVGEGLAGEEDDVVGDGGVVLGEEVGQPVAGRCHLGRFGPYGAGADRFH